MPIKKEQHDLLVWAAHLNPDKYRNLLDGVHRYAYFEADGDNFLYCLDDSWVDFRSRRRKLAVRLRLRVCETNSPLAGIQITRTRPTRSRPLTFTTLMRLWVLTTGKRHVLRRVTFLLERKSLRITLIVGFVSCRGFALQSSDQR